MKKKVLFALIALMSFVTSWATPASGISVGGYTVYLSNDVVAVPDLPTVTSIKNGSETLDATAYEVQGVFDAGKKKVSATQTPTAGRYYLGIYVTEETSKKFLYVPFTAGKVVAYSRVNNADAFTEAMKPNGAYALYYAQYPWADVVYTGGDDPIYLITGDKIVDGNVDTSERFAANDNRARADQWWADLHDEYGEDVESRLWSVTGVEDGPNEDNIAFSFAGENNENAFGDIAEWQIVLTYKGEDGGQHIMPWGNTFFGPQAKQYGLASVERDIADESQVASPKGFGVAYNGFDISKLQVLMIPANMGELYAESVTVQDVQPKVEYTESFEYDGTVQKPDFSATNGDSYVTVDEAELTEGVDYEVVYGNENSTTVGDYTFTINFIGAYSGAQSFTEGKYRINGHTLAINLAYVYKNYGEADPVHPSVDNFEIEGGLLDGDSKEDIAQWLVIKRATGKEGEDVGQYEYYYDFTQEYYTECQYKIIPLQTTSNLIISPRPLTINVEPTYKKYHAAEPAAFTYTVDAAQLIEADKAKATGTPGENDIITSISRAAGEAVAQGENAYAFTATSKNYKVTVANKFEIRPTDETGGVTVTFTPASYVYNGLAQTPVPIVKDGNTPLTADDYEVVGYENNKDAGTATCNIKLKGSYVATGDASKKSGTFTITKAPLTIKAKSYEEVPGNGFEIEYEGFVNGEKADGLAATYQDAPGTTKPYFVKPTGVTMGDAIETDVYPLTVNKTGVTAINYNITFQDGLLALNDKPIIYVYADEQSQVYGDAEKELTVTAEDLDGNELDEATKTNYLFILGKPVYTITKEEGKDVGVYDINVVGPTVLKECNVIYVSAEEGYEITPRGLILKGVDVTKVYGAADPTFDALVYDGETPWTREQMTAVGIINNGPNNTGYYVGCGDWNWQAQAWQHDENVGEYDIVPHLISDTYGDGNYVITEVKNGKFTITKAPVTITAENKTKQLGQPDPNPFTVKITDANGEEVSREFYDELADYYIVERTEAAETKENVGSHTINVHAPKDGETEVKPTNFTITFKNGVLTITKAQMYVLANDQWIDYGGSINPYDVTIWIPGAQGYEMLKWNKRGKNGLSEEDEKVNARIKSLVELSVLEGKNKIGANEDAYELTVQESGDYELATEAAEMTKGDDVVKFETGFKNGYLTVYPLTVIPLDMENLAQVLEDHKGLEGITFIMPARKMIHDEWYAWVFPFDVQPSTLFGRMWGYGAAETLDAAKSQNGNVVFALQVYNKIKANTPFIAKIERDIDADEMKEIRIVNQTIPADFSYTEARPATVAEDGGVKFVGLYEDYKGPQANQLYLAATSTKPTREFYPGGPKSANVTLVQTNAYLEFPTAEAAAKARIFIEEEDGTFTAINGVAAEADAAVAGEGWYTISGVKLNAQPTEKGIYIFNGKKVAIQ